MWCFVHSDFIKLKGDIYGDATTQYTCAQRGMDTEILKLNFKKI